jgi:hypothetical protein
MPSSRPKRYFLGKLYVSLLIVKIIYNKRKKNKNNNNNKANGRPAAAGKNTTAQLVR